jgi:uncharacterized phiE125 gp8 family phage protein
LLITIEAATVSPVSQAQAVAQLRLDLDPEDAMDAAQLDRLAEMIADAVDYVQDGAALALAPATVEQREDFWPPCNQLRLQGAPVREVDSVKYVDPDGAEVELDPSDYQVVLAGNGCGELWFTETFLGPSLRLMPGAVRIRYAIGFNDPADAEGDPRLVLPGRARQAVLLVAGAWFNNREMQGQAVDAADRLISRLKVYL